MENLAIQILQEKIKRNETFIATYKSVQEKCECEIADAFVKMQELEAENMHFKMAIEKLEV